MSDIIAEQCLSALRSGCELEENSLASILQTISSEKKDSEQILLSYTELLALPQTKATLLAEQKGLKSAAGVCAIGTCATAFSNLLSYLSPPTSVAMALATTGLFACLSNAGTRKLLLPPNARTITRLLHALEQKLSATQLNKLRAIAGPSGLSCTQLLRT